ncbi:hypothetical protein [Tenacibaculum agarivorans]|nr:hypothetical protein [Tenacibaculum agarivorans]
MLSITQNQKNGVTKFPNEEKEGPTTGGGTSTGGGGGDTGTGDGDR